MASEPKVGTAAGIAIAAALGSFVLTCTGHPMWGLVMGILAEPAGLWGFLRASSPRVRGAFISLAAMALGLLAIVVATLGLLGYLASVVV